MEPAVNSYDYLVKVSFAGEPKVGRNTLLFGKPGPNTDDVKFHNVKVGDKTVRLSCGLAPTPSITAGPIRAHVVVYMYDMTSPPSLDALSKWVKNGPTNSDCVPILVANKCDLNTVTPVAESKVKEFMHTHQIAHIFEICAVTGQNVDSLIQKIALCGLAVVRKPSSSQESARPAPVPAKITPTSSDKSSKVLAGLWSWYSGVKWRLAICTALATSVACALLLKRYF